MYFHFAGFLQFGAWEKPQSAKPLEGMFLFSLCFLPIFILLVFLYFWTLESKMKKARKPYVDFHCVSRYVHFADFPLLWDPVKQQMQKHKEDICYVYVPGFSMLGPRKTKQFKPTTRGEAPFIFICVLTCFGPIWDPGKHANISRVVGACSHVSKRFNESPRELQKGSGAYKPERRYAHLGRGFDGFLAGSGAGPFWDFR